VKTFLLSTRNAHKVAEIRALLGDAFEYLTLADFPEAPTVKEDADTFAGNAAKKAVELAAWVSRQGISTLKSQISDLWVLADDSGLEVDAIGGAPGVHSARFAALDQGAPGNSPDAANNAKLLRLLDGVPWEKRTARFRCVIAIVAVRTLAIATTDRSSVDVQGFQGGSLVRSRRFCTNFRRTGRRHEEPDQSSGESAAETAAVAENVGQVSSLQFEKRPWLAGNFQERFLFRQVWSAPVFWRFP